MNKEEVYCINQGTSLSAPSSLYIRVIQKRYFLSEMSLQKIQQDPNGLKILYQLIAAHFKIKKIKLYFCSGGETIEMSIKKEMVKHDTKLKGSGWNFNKINIEEASNIQYQLQTIEGLESRLAIKVRGQDSSEECFKYAWIFGVKLAPDEDIDTLVDRYFTITPPSSSKLHPKNVDIEDPKEEEPKKRRIFVIAGISAILLASWGLYYKSSLHRKPKK